jgi:hypothetical protein
MDIAKQIFREKYKSKAQVRNIVFSASYNHYIDLTSIANKYIIIRRNPDSSIEGYIEFKNPKLLSSLFKIVGVRWYTRWGPPTDMINYFSSGEFETFGDSHTRTRKPTILQTKDQELIRYIDYSNELEVELENARNLLPAAQREIDRMSAELEEKDEIIMGLKEKIKSLTRKLKEK